MNQHLQDGTEAKLTGNGVLPGASHSASDNLWFPTVALTARGLCGEVPIDSLSRLSQFFWKS